MAENGGDQMFVGSASAEAQKKKGVVERVQFKVNNVLADVRNENARRKNFGKEMQEKYINSYTRVVNELNPSLLKSFLQARTWQAKIESKVYGLGSAVCDTTAASIVRGTGKLLLLVGGVTGGVELGVSMKDKKWPKPGVLLGAAVATYGGLRANDIANKIGDKSAGEWIAKNALNATEFVGLHGAKLLNKVIGRPAPAPQMG
jgi:hypothetical protein